MVAWLGVGTLALGGSFLLDPWARAWALDHRCQAADRALGVYERLGELPYVGGVCVGGWVGSRLASNSRLERAFLSGLIGAGAAGLAVQPLKFGLGRARPYTDEGPWSWHGPTLREEYHSFPSGHTAVAFGAAGGFGFSYGNPWVLGGCVLLAGGVAAARVYHDAHWLSDVVASGVLGLGVGYAVARLNESISD